MDVFAHTLWSAAAAKGINLKLSKKNNYKPISITWSAFFGVMPDLFAFTIPFAWLIWSRLFFGQDVGGFRPGQEVSGTAAEMMKLSVFLYQISHSAVIFLLVFCLVWALKRRPYWELCGWLLHIFIDLPTHRLAFFPTPIFWPISSWKFKYGISWADRWFMIVNYSTLVLTYLYFSVRNKKFFSQIFHADKKKT